MDLVAVVFGAFVAAAGVAHFLAPRYFASLVPPWLPVHGAVVAVSGVADVAAGVLVLVPATRVIGLWLCAALISVYLVSHVDAVRRADVDGRLLDRPAAAVGRLVVNVGYVALAAWLAVALA